MSRRKILALITVLLVSFLGVAACRALLRKPGPDTVRRFLTVDGRARSYLLHVPPGMTAVERPALVLMFHGGGGDAVSGERGTRFSELADRERFLAVYPEGVARGWNDGRIAPDQPAIREGADDVGFVAALLEDVERTHPFDRRRVFSTGISNGAIFSHTLAARRSDLIAAIAPVVGGMASPFDETFRPEHPVSVFVIQGVEDPLVPYDGGKIARGDRGEIIPTEEALRKWIEHNGCAAEPARETLPDASPGDGCRVHARRWTGGRGGVDVVLYRIAGGGHTWPGGSQYLPEGRIGRVCRDFDGTEAIWAFFAAHPKR